MPHPTLARFLARRLLVAAGVGVVVAVVSYLAAFLLLRDSFLIHSPALMTRLQLSNITALVEDHKQQKGRYPARLTDIDRLQDGTRTNDDGRAVDGWGHPIYYSATEDGFTLFSFGRDGEPGGEGDDADVYYDRPLEPPSLRRFTFDLPTQPIRWACVLSGVGAAVIVGSPTREGARELWAKAAGTTVGAILVAIFMSLIHIPSGH